MPMPSVATDALLAERKKNPAIGAGLVFPSRKNPSRPITSHLASYWLRAGLRNRKDRKTGRNALAWVPAKMGDGTPVFPTEGCCYGR